MIIPTELPQHSTDGSSENPRTKVVDGLWCVHRVHEIYSEFLSGYIQYYLWQRGLKLINKKNNKNSGISHTEWIKTGNI